MLRFIATSYTRSACEKDLICSFFFIYDKQVTIRKRKYVLKHFAATANEACKQLWDVHMVIFGHFDGSVLQSSTDEECIFLFN